MRKGPLTTDGPRIGNVPPPPLVSRSSSPHCTSRDCAAWRSFQLPADNRRTSSVDSSLPAGRVAACVEGGAATTARLPASQVAAQAIATVRNVRRSIVMRGRTILAEQPLGCVERVADLTEERIEMTRAERVAAREVLGMAVAERDVAAAGVRVDVTGERSFGGA